MKIDAVIPTVGEWSLPYCVEYLQKRVPINNLILVAPKSMEERIDKFADIFVPFDEKNIGKARAKGLELVETELYASIDSDIIISPKWYSWCIKTIDAPQVAACQGYGKALAKIYVSYEIKLAKSGGMHRGLCCLGNTLLKTSIVEEIGMPEIKVAEDRVLRMKMENAGYKWITNLDLVSIHLKTDVDIWKRHVWWGKMGGEAGEIKPYHLHQLRHHFAKDFFRLTWKENLYRATLRLCRIYGHVSSEATSKFKRLFRICT